MTEPTAHDINRAEHALHERRTLAGEAAAAAGIPGTFRPWERNAALTVLAIRQLTDQPATQPGITTEDERFLETLLAGYETTGTVAEFIAAEHQHPAVQRYLATEHGTPIAAAAMTVHDDVAVLGGASTLRAHRGKGAQSRLLQHRIKVATAAGCTLAIATASANSTSAANLQRAGFTLLPSSAVTPDADHRYDS